jgi:hypothetical protein
MRLIIEKRLPSSHLARNKISLSLSQKAKEQIDLAFAKAVIASMKPFSLFESEEWIDAFAKLGYKPPWKDMIGGPLLEKIYESIRQRVKEEILKSGSLINIAVDESTNISNGRIQNTASLLWMDSLSTGSQKTLAVPSNLQTRSQRQFLLTWLI